MFWKQAHEKYGHLTEKDEDIRRYLELSGSFQEDSYSGAVGYVSDLGHKWVAGRTPPGPVLEIGSGTGRHGVFYRGRREDFFPSEFADRFTHSAAWKDFAGRATRCDARKLPYRDASFVAVISIYNLEHIRDLQSVLAEVHRVLRAGGKFLVALPCEGGLFWNLGRELTTRRMFQKKFGLNYDKLIAFEHVRDYRGVAQEIEKSGLFSIQARRMFPFQIPTPHLNLVACLECVAKKH
jgi:SAM-dependent methyltransferase